MINQEQREFFEEVLEYLRNELETRLDSQTVALISKIHGPAYALKDKLPAKQGRVYLTDRRGRQRTKPIDKLRPYDVPEVMRKIEANVPNALVSEHWRELRRGWMR
jgi:hypothetical protein